MIYKKTKSGKEKICSKIVLRINSFSQGVGLMFHKKIIDEAHVFVMRKEKWIPLTNWFVFYPIDILYLNKDKKIVEMKKSFKPFTNYNPKENAMYVVELPEKTITKKNLNIGNTLEF